MRKIILLVWFFGMMLVTVGQKIVVLEEQTSNPIDGALVAIMPLALHTVTNEEGGATLDDLRGEYRVTVRALGYQTWVKDLIFDPSDEITIYLKPTLYNLDQVIISATKWSQTMDNVPSKIIKIDKEVVQFQNPQTAADLLGFSGKVFIQKSQQGGGSPMIRGFATNRLIYSIDGVRMNTAIFRGGNIQNVINLDPFAIESTEVLFGPGSVIYGSDAIGGVMSFETIKPKLSADESNESSANFFTRYSSANNETTGHLDVALRNQNWSSISSISYWDYDHLRQGSHGPEEYLKAQYVKSTNGNDEIVTQDNPLLQVPSGYSQFNLMQKIRFKPNQNWDLNYGFHFSSTSNYGRYDRHNRLENGLPFYSVWDYGPQLWKMNLLSAVHTSSNPMYDQLIARLAHQRFEESRIVRLWSSNSRSTREESVNAYSFNMDLTKRLKSRHRLFYGIEYVLDDVASMGTETNLLTKSTDPGPSRYPQSTWQSLGIYINEEYKITERMTIQSGLRYGHTTIEAIFDTTFFPLPFTDSHLMDGALTGSIGAVWRPSSTLVLTTNFGTAFRSPNVDDMGKIFDSEPGSVTLPNPNLKSEYAYNMDMGFTKIIGEHIKWDLTAFYTWLNRAIVRRNDQLNGLDSIMYDGQLSQIQSLQNAAKANIYGIQTGLEIKLPIGVNIVSDVNFQQGTNESTDGSRVSSRHATPFFGVTRIQYRKEPWMIELNVSFQGTRTADELAIEEKGKTEIYAIDADGNAYAQGWHTLNLKSSWKINRWLQLNAGMENILDLRYRTYSSGISAPGRNIVISLRAGFK
jgi:hemoglobin/transferrin/lactoferrin receptor protein